MSKKSQKPRYSIVIPAYNEADYLSETLKSLQNQSYCGEYEIIVVNNNSTDDTHEVAKAYGVKVIDEKNRGVCWARQKGLRVADGEIIVQADADTDYKKDWLKKIDDKFNKRPKLVAVGGPCIFTDAPAWGRIYPKIFFGLADFGFKTFRKTYYASATNIAFKKTAFEKYDTSLTQGGDELYLLSQLRTKGCVYFYKKNPTYTSSRRLTRGFVYNFFVTFLIYYVLEYYLSRLFKRPILGSYPTFRSYSNPKKFAKLKIALMLLILIIVVVSIYKSKHIVLASPIHFNNIFLRII